MSDKYIIKNCPIIYEKIKLDGNNVPYVDKYWCRGSKLKLCKNCTDCVMKQIVEKCKKYIENYNDKVFYDEDDVQILMGKVMLSQSILSEILSIQEAE